MRGLAAEGGYTRPMSTLRARVAVRLPRVLAAALVLLAAAAAMAGPRVAAPPSPTCRGGVASAAPTATEAGLELLRAGGSAADAAVATALALSVVHPAAGNLGGGGFAVVRFGGDAQALDFRETAPAAATHDMYLGPDGSPRPDASLVGPLAAGVPGSVVGYYELQRRFGRLPWRRVVLPAIHLAQRGFKVTQRLHDDLAANRGLLARFPETAAVWLPHGHVPEVGTLVRLPRLAWALQDYAERGPRALTAGKAASAIVRASGRHGGILTEADLAGYRAVWREPLRFDAFGWQVASMPLPSSGGIILGETLGIAERRGWAGIPPGGVDRLDLLIEAWRRAFADRFLLGDPSTTRAGAADLLAPAWLDRRAKEIDLARATPSANVRWWSAPRAPEGRQTTHLSVIDGEGNVVALTTTLNGSFGCGLLVPELGILLNNEMDDFATAPGRPNLYGLVQGEANAVGPGKRMLSSMSPTVAWRGSEVLALGSPGGSHIPTAVAQVFLLVAVDGMALQQAVDAPRIHEQWLPDEVEVEPTALSREAEAELLRRGHHLKAVGHLGEVAAVLRLPDRRCEAAADPRGPGAAGTIGR